MTLPIAYPIPLEGSGLQGMASAERPWCAMRAACSQSYKLGDGLDARPFGGQVRGMKPQEIRDRILDALKESYPEIDTTRFLAWGLTGLIQRGHIPTEVDGLKLDEYQLDTITKLRRAGGVLALGCGLGKTSTAVATALAMVKNPFIYETRCWIVCPVNAFGAWKRFIPTLKLVFTDVQIISMDSLHKVEGAKHTGGVVIFDEVHMLGDTKARRTKAAHELRKGFDSALCLTGTMLHGGIHKALSILDLAIPGEALFANQWKAGDYFRCLVKKKIGARTVTVLERPTGRAKEVFLEYVSRITVSLSKTSPLVRSAITIPEQTLHTIELGDMHADLSALALDYVSQEMGDRAADRFAQGKEAIPTAQEVAHALCRSGLDAKLDWLMDELDDPTQGVVVFAQYMESLDEAEKRIAAAGMRYRRIDGSTTPTFRQVFQGEFQRGECQIMLGQITAMGVSMDLQRAYISVALDVNWKAADYSQALARTCRRGQPHECHHFDLVANKLQALVIKRLRAADNFDASVTEYQDLKRAIPIQVNNAQGV